MILINICICLIIQLIYSKIIDIIYVLRYNRLILKRHWTSSINFGNLAPLKGYSSSGPSSSDRLSRWSPSWLQTSLICLIIYLCFSIFFCLINHIDHFSLISHILLYSLLLEMSSLSWLELIKLLWPLLLNNLDLRPNHEDCSNLVLNSAQLKTYSYDLGMFRGMTSFVLSFCVFGSLFPWLQPNTKLHHFLKATWVQREGHRHSIYLQLPVERMSLEYQQ